MIEHGFLRVCAAVPTVRVADPFANAAAIRERLADAEAHGAHVALFPELSLVGYTCGDLFHQPTLLDAAQRALQSLLDDNPFSGFAVVGLPLAVDGALYNVAAAFVGDELLGFVPKSHLPTYREFYEHRWFARGGRGPEAAFAGLRVPFGTDLLFDASDAVPGLVIGVEICEDLWVPVPPSSLQALAGASLLLNLSASNEVLGKAAYRRGLVASQSGRCVAAYAYVSCGVHESTTDVVFGGHAIVAENGAVLAESTRFERGPTSTFADVDLARLQHERWKTNSFADDRPESQEGQRYVPFQLPERANADLRREVDAHPFVPAGADRLRERCEEIFQIQVAGLARRFEQIGRTKATMGVSGGLDSTLALLVACKTLDRLGWPRTSLHGFTMPGFGTTARTLGNARRLMASLGVTAREVDVRALCFEEMRAVGHRPFGIDLTGLDVESLGERLRALPADQRHDLTFENVQARARMHLLMNQGFVVGTGDLSELALGWCTYGGDHLSMYNPNASVPKTLVRFLVRWAAENEFEGPVRETLLDVVATRISPELLPTSANGEIVQDTEDAIGPYELHDFFLYHFLRYGASPSKILALARHARFDRVYAEAEVRKWLAVFVRRFFANQFKRSCLPDGPKVGTISLSPRGDWRMPSDAQAAAWLADLDG